MHIAERKMVLSMSLLTFVRRVLSPRDGTLKNLPISTENKPSLSEGERDARILELLNNTKPNDKTIEELARLMGQTDTPKLQSISTDKRQSTR
jgi:hypothetical protein